MPILLSRRTFAGSVGAATVAVAMRPAMAFAAIGEDARLDALFTRIFDSQLRLSPQSATSLGLDKDALAGLRSQLTDSSQAGLARSVANTRNALADLSRVNAAALSPAMKLNLDVVRYQLETRLEAPRLGLDDAQSPYRIAQRSGAACPPNSMWPEARPWAFARCDRQP